MSIGDCWSTFNILHEVFGSEEDSNEVSEPVGAFIHDSCVSVHVDLDLVPLPQLHHHTLPHHAVLVIRVLVLIIEAGNLISIAAKREQTLLHIMGADMNSEHVAPVMGAVNTPDLASIPPPRLVLVPENVRYSSPPTS